MKKSLGCIRRFILGFVAFGFLAALLACTAQGETGRDPGDGSEATAGTTDKPIIQELELMPDDWVNTDPKKAQIQIPLPWPRLDEALARGTSEVVTGIADSKSYTNYMRIYI